MTDSPELDAARRAAQAAAGIILRYYHGDLDVTIKGDSSPVTRADIEAEQAIREILLEAFPDYGFYGEETGRHRDDADNLWLVDPLDGTKSFVRGYPFVSTQIALMRKGVVHLGVSSAPMFEEIAWAERGTGAWLGGERLQVSDVATVGDCTLSAGNIGTLARSDAWGRYGRLVSEVNRIRGYGDFYHYHLLAAGRIDVVVESDVNILDIAALSVIVEEAGGRFTALDGGPVGLETTTVLATNGVLHDTVSRALHG